MEKLSKMQLRVLNCIADGIRRHGFAPSMREIGAELDLKAPSTVHFHITRLEQLGYLERLPGKGRALTLSKAAIEVLNLTPAVGNLRQAALAEEVSAKQNRVPIVGNVAAGSPILAQECIEDYLTFDTDRTSGELFALRVRGESMLGVGILPNDLVVVRRQSTANNGEIVVALLGDEATVKIFRRQGRSISLLPANPDYSPIDGRDAAVLGKVIAVVRNY